MYGNFLGKFPEIPKKVKFLKFDLIETAMPRALSIQPKIPGGEANETEIFRKKISTFWVYLIRLS